MKLIAELMRKMIAYSGGNLHDIRHMMKVWGYAKTIGELEGLDAAAQRTLEAAAIVHDIACPLCRAKYGNTNGKYQEAEGGPLAAAFLQDTGLTADEIRRVAWLVAHHHTYGAVDGADYQILLEADYLVNACESCYSPAAIAHARASFFRTAAGLRLLDSIYLRPQTGAGQ